MSKDQPDLILGTAGHIDHGKSALVMALTGTDPDRLTEEKQRGITITLGFAQLELPNGQTMGVVDVPGHERFVRQMIAGATGVDIALLVIAADDGIMPQTIEHLAVLQTLGIRACVVALTKADLVDEDWIEFMTAEIEEFLADTPYERAPIVAVSSKTGRGLDELKAAIQDAGESVGRAQRAVSTRMPVDRSFIIKGAGTVVTGTLWSGTVSPGDELEALPQQETYRVRGVQIHGEEAACAQAGNRVAINLADASTADVEAGSFLCKPGSVRLTDRFDCTLTYLDTARSGKPLKTGARMHVAHGTREVLGRVLLCDSLEALKPGETAYAQVRLEEELPICSDDRFVVRTYSPVRVAGGGRVLLAHPRRRTNLSESMRALLDALDIGDFERAVACAVETQSLPATAEQIARLVGTDADEVDRILDSAGTTIVAIGEGEKHYTTKPVFRKIASAIDRTLIGFHSDNPGEAGMAKEALRRACFPTMSTACFDALVAMLADQGSVVLRDGLVGHPSAQGGAQQALDNAADALAELLRRQSLTPSLLPALAEEAGLTKQMAGKAMASLVETGRAYRVSADLFFDADAIAEAKAAIEAHLKAGGAGTAAALKEAMGTTRKFAVPLLERFDAEGFTKRVGDERSLA